MTDTTFINKETVVETDWLNDVNDAIHQGSGRVALGVTDLRSKTPASDQTYYLKYHTTIGDGGHGLFRAVTGASPGTYTDNGGTIIVPTGGDGSSAWLREYSGPVYCSWFGASPSATATTNASAIQAAIDFVVSEHNGGRVILGYGAHSTDSPINVKEGVFFTGLGSNNNDSAVSTISPTSDFSNSSPHGVLYVSNARGWRIENIQIDMTNAGSDDYGFEMNGGWYGSCKSLFIKNLSGTQIGVYTHVGGDGQSWNTFESVIVKGTAGTGFHLTNDDPYSGGASGRTNQNTFTMCQARSVDIGFHLDGCGGGNTFYSCQAEEINTTCVKIENHTTTEGAWPVWIGGEIGSGSITGFDGEIHVIDCINNCNTEVTNGAIVQRADTDRIEEFGSTGDSIMGQPWHFTGEAGTTSSTAITVPDSTATDILKIPQYGTNRHFNSLLLITAYEGTPSNNSNVIAHLSHHNNGDRNFTIINEHNGGVNLSAATFAYNDGGDGYNYLNLTHTEGVDVTVKIAVHCLHNISGLTA